eukprot:CAMPEP_0196758946 /NCGR_PEP_ID=MMETSP1091-20130531/104451_1 /TAXON_ID=302021 /ORGANISM="Rhodomonas sp., Strain CCMP768" /LENGTH=126 /DNA_ID=CAMNT_0042107785 /DNA_START=630 /DNA_END=1010 /DNA_ORIENTATION=-
MAERRRLPYLKKIDNTEPPTAVSPLVTAVLTMEIMSSTAELTPHATALPAAPPTPSQTSMPSVTAKPQSPKTKCALQPVQNNAYSPRSSDLRLVVGATTVSANMFLAVVAYITAMRLETREIIAQK